jgi:hypothetical protein
LLRFAARREPAERRQTAHLGVLQKGDGIQHLLLAERPRRRRRAREVRQPAAVAHGDAVQAPPPLARAAKK